MRHILTAIVLTLLAGAATAQTVAARDSEDPVALTRSLYVSASYVEALTAIERLKVSPRPEQRSDLERYEALCLLALDRTAEAERVIEALISRDPLYRFDATDAAPRMRATFSSVRRRVLPDIARSLYAEGKRAYDRKAFAEAAATLERALPVIAEPDAESVGIDDLQLLAAGFIDLSRAAMAAAARPQPPLRASAPLPALTQSPGAAAAPTDPVAIHQDLPMWTFLRSGAMDKAEFHGAIEVDINEAGEVVAARIVKGIHPGYDPLLLEAARRWKYWPAMVNGKPVRAQKQIEISLRPR